MGVVGFVFLCYKECKKTPAGKCAGIFSVLFTETVMIRQRALFSCCCFALAVNFFPAICCIIANNINRQNEFTG